MISYKAVIFDLDGTLVDSITDLANAMNHILRSHQLPTHEREKYNYFVGNGILKLVERALPESEREEKRVRYFQTEMIRYYQTHCLDNTQPYKEIPELLNTLSEKGLKICVLSNKADELTQKIVANLFSKWKFSAIRGARPDTPIKPNPTGALLIASQIQISPSEFIYLGDTDVDIYTANAAGMFSVGCTWGFRTEKELKAAGAKKIISHPLELNLF